VLRKVNLKDIMEIK